METMTPNYHGGGVVGQKKPAHMSHSFLYQQQRQQRFLRERGFGYQPQQDQPRHEQRPQPRELPWEGGYGLKKENTKQEVKQDSVLQQPIQRQIQEQIQEQRPPHEQQKQEKQQQHSNHSHQPHRQYAYEPPSSQKKQIPEGRKSLSALDDKKAEEFRRNAYAWVYASAHGLPMNGQFGRGGGQDQLHALLRRPVSLSAAPPALIAPTGSAQSAASTEPANNSPM
jgi:hypothetical protein